MENFRWSFAEHKTTVVVVFYYFSSRHTHFRAFSWQQLHCEPCWQQGSDQAACDDSVCGESHPTWKVPVLQHLQSDADCIHKTGDTKKYLQITCEKEKKHKHIYVFTFQIFSPTLSNFYKHTIDLNDLILTKL